MDTDGAYFKDINDDLDKYEGIWVWEENGNKLTIVLEKSIQDDWFPSHYEDLIVGNYKYEENGIVIVDTMTNPIINPNLTDDGYHITLWGDNKTPFITYMRGVFVDPVRSYYADYGIFCHYISPILSLPGEPKQIKFMVIVESLARTRTGDYVDSTTPHEPRIPYDVVLTKQ
jgi:hypothetical protein